MSLAFDNWENHEYSLPCFQSEAQTNGLHSFHRIGPSSGSQTSKKPNILLTFRM